MVALLSALRRDLQRLGERFKPLAGPAPGMYTYRRGGAGGQRRLHLRVEDSGDAVLFVDVTDAIHLNATAAEFAKWACDELPLDAAERRMKLRHGGRSRMQWLPDLQAMYQLVARLSEPGDECPTCALPQFERPPLFSTAVTAPFKADLALTYDCNNDCPHCYNEADRLRLGLLEGEQWCRIVDRLCQVGVPHLIFTGGEATLHPHLLDIIGYADRAGPVCGLNTNGRRLAHRDYAEALATGGLNHVQITLGSHRAEVHDRMMNARAFDQTVRGIENALQSGLHTITNTTLMRMNAAEIEETIEFLYQLGIRTFAVNGMIYSGGGFATSQAIPEQEMSALLLQIRDRAAALGMKFLWYTPTQYCRLSPVELEIGAKRCNAGEYSLCIEPNGDVLPCQSYYLAAGNILRDSWESIWKSDLFRSFREREADPAAHGLPEMCWECPELSLCGGGCRIEREAQQGIRTAGCGGCGSGGCGSQLGVTPDASDAPAGFVALEAITVRHRRRGSGHFAQ